VGRIGIYVERYSISNSYEMNALMRLGQVARKKGHQTDFLFRPDIYKIPDYDAIFIRALTDPLNAAYVAARTAEMHGVRVIDDPDSIVICCDKINMYRHLMRAGVPIPDTLFIDEGDLTRARCEELFDQLGIPLVMKAPNTSFSMYVEKAGTADEFIRIGRRYLRRADRIVVQRFVQSDFDWRVGVLGGEPLYVCRYVIPRKRWKIMSYTPDGKAVYGPVKGVALADADPHLLECARAAAAAIGQGIYGVDLKESDGGYTVIEVNDNPTIEAGDEDQKAGELYEKLVRYLVAPKDTPA
jgi:glutathione synthase/RimK-type ligase-like ATP-grasp enzyme